jgi:hypothetical protein
MEDIDLSEDEVALVEEIRGESKKRLSLKDLGKKKISQDELDDLFNNT